MKKLIIAIGFGLWSFPSFATQNISANQIGDITLGGVDSININSGGTLNGNINLGSSSSSALNLNSGGVLNGNLTMGNSSQITTFNGGNLNGTINGSGKITIADNLVTNGNIGSSTSVSSLTINASKTLNLATNNNSLAASGALTISSGGTLIVGSGTVAASIQGASDGVGNVKFNSNNTLGGSVGTSTTTLSLIEIASGATLTTNTRNIDATLISIYNNAILNYGSGTIVGVVEGQSSGVGSFVFNNTKTTSFTIGQSNIISNIDVANSATVTLGGNIAANTINIGAGTSGKIKSNGKNISANNIKLFSGATLEIDAASTISGAINGNSSGNGIVQFSGSAPLNWTSSLGSTNKLAQVLVSNEATLNINNNISLNASDITIGEGSSGGIGSPILTQNNGVIGADSNSEIRLNTDSTFNYNGGVINGTIHGTSSGKGTFNINHDYTNNSEIGKSFDLANLNIASGRTLTAGANISANNILLSGSMNLGNSAKTITGNLATSGGAAIIDLGSASHIINGNFSTISGDILKLTALNNSNIGKLSISGNVNVASGTDLQIYFNSDDGYLSNGAKIKIVSGGSGSANTIIDSDINVNNSGSNKSGFFTFKTESSGSNLFLIATRDNVDNFTSNKIAQDIYSAVDQAGAGAKGELRNLQKLIDNSATSNKSRESALKSIIPQSNREINNSAINSVSSSVNVVNSRLDNVLFAEGAAKNPDNFFINNNFQDASGSLVKNNIRELSNLNFENEIFDNQAIWVQGFKSSATADNVGDSDGYDYENYGLAIGVDQEVEKDLRVGIATSFSNALVKSDSVNHKETNINSYQFNLYGGYNFDPYFVSGIIGMALNKYSATRSMPDMNLNAKANYDGETYIAKFESGINEKFESGLFLIPKIALTAAKNQVSTYSESGAGTLNLIVSNQHSNSLEVRIGSDVGYDNLMIDEFSFRPKIKLSYGYNLLAQDQSSKNNFQGQDDSFQIKSPNDDKASLKYGLGFDLYDEDMILVNLEYSVESRSNYKSNTSSVYLRYRF